MERCRRTLAICRCRTKRVEVGKKLYKKIQSNRNQNDSGSAREGAAGLVRMMNRMRRRRRWKRPWKGK